MLNATYQLNNDLIIQLSDNFDAETVISMKDELETFSHANRDIIFDLSLVRFIDSSGIGAIVFLYKRLATRGFTVSVAGLAQQPLELFQMLFLDKTINCYSSFCAYKESLLTIKVAS